jgi:predicted DCC family thiol-disulfide oxidoreductase YuxK
MSIPPPHGSEPPGYRHLVLYDGVCGLCNRLNTFLLPRDVDAVFAFASLQSEAGQSLLKRFGRASDSLDTFYVVTNYRSASPVLLAKSRAALFVLTTLGGFWRWLALFGVLPSTLLDRAYDVIARNRYRILGRSETCLLPAPEYKTRFIDV